MRKSANAIKENIQTDVPDTNERAALLKGIIDRFSESSKRLEVRYQEIVHESNALREQLRLKDEQMQRATRLAALGEAAATIAHEIRNPLGAMTLMTSLLVDDDTVSPMQQKMLGQIQTSIDRLESFVCDLLQFAKGTTIRLAPLNLHSLLERIFSSHHLLQNQAVVVVKEFSGQSFVLGHDSSLERIFTNLLANAVRAMQNSGTLHVSCTQPNEKTVAVTIRDSGPGVPESLMMKIFEPFVSASEGGTGLGLAIVKQLAEAHGATVLIKNNPGAEFTISFPVGK